MIIEGGLKQFCYTYFINELIKRLVDTGEDLKKLLFVMDNCTIHHAGTFTTCYNAKMNILYLPPYSPMLNPIELCWNQWKKNLSKKTWSDKKSFFREVVNTGLNLRTQTFNNNFYKSFKFHEPCLEKCENIFKHK